MVGQEMQRGVGENQLWPLRGRPVRDVLLDESRLWKADPRMAEHRFRGVDPGDLRVGEAVRQQSRAAARPAAQIIDDRGDASGTRASRSRAASIRSSSNFI